MKISFLSIHSKHTDGSSFFLMISYDFPLANKDFLSILNRFYTSFQPMTLQSHSNCYYMINLKLGFNQYEPKDDGKVWLLWRDNIKKRVLKRGRIGEVDKNVGLEFTN